MRKLILATAAGFILPSLAWATDARMSYTTPAGVKQALGMVSAVCGTDSNDDPTQCSSGDTAAKQYTTLGGSTGYLGYVVPVCSVVDGVPQVCDFSSGAAAYDLATTALTTANAAIPKAGNMDSSGNIIAPVNTSIVSLKGNAGYGLKVSDAYSASWSGFGITADYRGDPNSLLYPGELVFWGAKGAANLVALQQLDISGYAAITFRGLDPWNSGPGAYEHGAIGYGGQVPYGFRSGRLNWIENSDYDMTSNPHSEPTAFTIQQTGGEPINGYTKLTIAATPSLKTVTLVGGGNFPSGLDGMDIRSIGDGYGLLPPRTTVVSGSGTSTLTLSAAPLGNTDGSTVIIGTDTYHQYYPIMLDGGGTLDLWRYQDAYQGQFTGEPIARFDFNDGTAKFSAHPVKEINGDYTLSKADCGTTLAQSALAAENIPAGLPAGCRIVITRIGASGTSIVPQAGMTLAWYDTQAETGTYTLPGQYASAVIETKSGTLATIERGQ